jgi:hypothetical protein
VRPSGVATTVLSDKKISVITWKTSISVEVGNLHLLPEYNIPATVEEGIISRIVQFYNEPSTKV